MAKRKNTYYDFMKGVKRFIPSWTDFDAPDDLIDDAIPVTHIDVPEPTVEEYTAQIAFAIESLDKEDSTLTPQILVELLKKAHAAYPDEIWVYNGNIRPIIRYCVEALGPKADLNWMNVRMVTEMDGLFAGMNFNGDISEWDVSNVWDMTNMFKESTFNGDISAWDVSNVSNFAGMFEYSAFNGDISGWNMEHAFDVSGMFKGGKFNRDISGWKLPECRLYSEMFFNNVDFCQDLSSWAIESRCIADGMFAHTKMPVEYMPMNYDVTYDRLVI